MAIYIKNNTVSVQVWDGMQFQPSEYRFLTESDKLSFGTDTEVLSAITAGEAIVATADDGNKDVTNINQALTILRDDAYQRDDEGAQVIRHKMAPVGWLFQQKWFEITTSELSSQFCKDFKGVDIVGVVYKFYDAADVEITDQATANTDCVKSVLDIELTYDFELLGGSVRVGKPPNNTQDLRLWIVAIPDVPAAAGGELVFVNGINLRYFNQNEVLHVDGRTPKLLVYNTVNHTNKLRFICKHTAGIKQKLIFSMEYYKA